MLVEARAAEGLSVDGFHHRQRVALSHVSAGPLVGYRREPEGLPLEVRGFLFAGSTTKNGAEGREKCIVYIV